LAVAPIAAHANEMVAPAPVAAPAEAAASAAVEAAVDHATEVKETTLKDGTKIVIEGDMVSVVGADGAKTPAPDAEHELADGTKVKTVGGKIVVDAAAPDAHSAH
jgi:hypothetical protein